MDDAANLHKACKSRFDRMKHRTEIWHKAAALFEIMASSLFGVG
jgi:molybdopterin synthase catalytic subunit